MSLVMKFGGSSVANAACMREVATLVKTALPRAPLVVLSAMDKTTDGLFACAKAAARGDLDGARQSLDKIASHHRAEAAELVRGEGAFELGVALDGAFAEIDLLLRSLSLLRTLGPETMDAIASFGERLSTRIFTSLLQSQGVDAELVDARVAMRTDGRSGSAQPQMDAVRSLSARHLEPKLRPDRAVVTQGYIGATEGGLTTTLGRGGSDYTAAIFAAALRASECQIWTDVEGVLTADPRIVEEALPIPELSFAEAAELAAFGAKVLHPATIQPAIEGKVPVTVRHTRRPAGRFTTITGNVRTGRPVTALATRGPVTVLTVTSSRMLAQAGYLAKLFEVFGRLRVSVDLIATAEVSVSMTVDADAPLPVLLRELSSFATVEAAENRAIVAIVGDRLKHTPGPRRARVRRARRHQRRDDLDGRERDQPEPRRRSTSSGRRPCLQRLSHRALRRGLTARAGPSGTAGSRPAKLVREAARAVKIGIFGRGRLGFAIASAGGRRPRLAVGSRRPRRSSPSTSRSTRAPAAAVPGHLEWALAHGCPLVIGDDRVGHPRPRRARRHARSASSSRRTSRSRSHSSRAWPRCSGGTQPRTRGSIPTSSSTIRRARPTRPRAPRRCSRASSCTSCPRKTAVATPHEGPIGREGAERLRRSARAGRREQPRRRARGARGDRPRAARGPRARPPTPRARWRRAVASRIAPRRLHDGRRRARSSRSALQRGGPMSTPFEGLSVALATPFDRYGELDVPAFRQLVRHVVDGGVDVPVALGTSGEAATLDDRERDL